MMGPGFPVLVFSLPPFDIWPQAFGIFSLSAMVLVQQPDK
jgi:hypothetical protein